MGRQIVRDMDGTHPGQWNEEQDFSVFERTANKGAVSGYASLNASSKVVEDPANATATPTASKIPIADGSGKLDGWMSDASTSGKGIVKLAGDLGGTALLPRVLGLNSIPLGSVVNGQYLYMSGGSIAGTTAVPGDSPLTALGKQVASSAVTSVQFSGLTTLAVGEAWILECFVRNSTGGAVVYYLQFNSDTTLTNYRSEALQADGTSVTAARSSDGRVMVLSAGDRSNFQVRINRDQEGRTRAFESGTREDAVAVMLRFQGVVWNTTTDPTSIEIVADTASGIGIGSQFHLYKLAAAA